MEHSVTLIVQYWEAEEPARRAELLESMRRNLAHPCVAAVHVLTEQRLSEEHAPFLRHPKASQVVVGARLSFARAFRYANRFLRGRTCVLANADIHFDASLGRARALLDYYAKERSAGQHQGEEGEENGEGGEGEEDGEGKEKKSGGGGEGKHGEGEGVATVLALQRWERDFALEAESGEESHGGYRDSAQDLASGVPGPESPAWRLPLRSDSQDAWVFASPLPLDELALGRLAFELGRPRCDNRAAFVLWAAGVNVRNPCWDLRARHVHRSAARPVVADAAGAFRFVPMELPLPGPWP